ncbi:ATPase family protein associated with various cellular activities (AAA) [Candidatus Nitrososphaera evergladensis SR1]|jgi:nitric oxide reductase NorQ protein|uniref:ATPase family protein associated with various cellular activities (AAA) n=1 Tax=Candidatus Nitrososphaera evergladensis SR1 TaxID=1459636 RepID=A0A075MTR6_9ARCH|nr:MoxR family ATPase [Candidatus Nitrososphaera evergladensis]AIF82679.1 ATPase family protein associated with various cellular activities (AAA) [Candidatus Nitrososphaera evergladensis SR1]
MATTELDNNGSSSQEVIYLDWNNALDVLEKAYKAGLFVLIIGPKGTGKTTLVRKFASAMEKELYSVNFSLRTRESHLVGTRTIDKGQINFVEGVLVKSMKEGTMLYLDELNAAEADVLLRLDEALDDRRQLVLKEAEGQLVKASPDWFVIATINPLSHVGTKELPPQLLSRFPVRMRLDYPPEDLELEIVKRHVKMDNDDGKMRDVKHAIQLARSLRDAAAVEELYYSPSLRETIAFAKMLNAGLSGRQAAEVVYANAYDQWGQVEYQKVLDMITSIFGDK